MSEFLSVTSADQVKADRATIALGRLGEELAAEFLVKNGYRIVMANFRVPVGRNSKGVQVTGEIDIVALDGEILCFIEVKTRRSDEFLPVIASVDLGKQRQIARTARIYRRIFGVWDMEFRFDVVTVLAQGFETPKLNLIKRFWNESVFKKRRWHHESWNEFF